MSHFVPWRQAVLSACRDLQNNSAPGATFTRQALIAYYLAEIVDLTGSNSVRPEQTLSYILQELRDQGEIEFFGNGLYKLPISPQRSPVPARPTWVRRTEMRPRPISVQRSPVPARPISVQYDDVRTRLNYFEALFVVIQGILVAALIFEIVYIIHTIS